MISSTLSNPLRLYGTPPLGVPCRHPSAAPCPLQHGADTRGDSLPRQQHRTIPNRTGSSVLQAPELWNLPSGPEPLSPTPGPRIRLRLRLRLRLWLWLRLRLWLWRPLRRWLRLRLWLWPGPARPPLTARAPRGPRPLPPHKWRLTAHCLSRETAGRQAQQGEGIPTVRMAADAAPA